MPKTFHKCIHCKTTFDFWGAADDHEKELGVPKFEFKVGQVFLHQNGGTRITIREQRATTKDHTPFYLITYFYVDLGWGKKTRIHQSKLKTLIESGDYNKVD